jgi:hypothetical protein
MAGCRRITSEKTIPRSSNREWQVSILEGSFLRLLAEVFGVQLYGERFSDQSLDTSVALMIDEAI